MLITLPEEPAEVETTRVVLVEWLSEPLVPLIVKGKLPVGVLVAVATVSVELAPALMEAGLNVPVALAGRPLVLRFTVPVNPFTAPTLTA
jgi:hypothetical protein